MTQPQPNQVMLLVLKSLGNETKTDVTLHTYIIDTSRTLTSSVSRKSQGIGGTNRGKVSSLQAGRHCTL